MNQEQQKTISLLSQQLLELEPLVGVRDMAVMVLDSIETASRKIKWNNDDEFWKQWKKLVTGYHQTKPRYAIILFYLDQLQKHLESSSQALTHAYLESGIDQLQQQIQAATEGLKTAAKTMRVNHKTILIHDHSHTLHSVLQEWSKTQEFSVIVAEQEPEKTHENIELLHRAGIKFQVVPDYMLSHLTEEIDLVLCGGVTIKDNFEVVMDPGSYSVIQQFSIAKIPICLTLTTDKFSLWPSKPKTEVVLHSHKRRHRSRNIDYQRIKYSHDRVPLAQFSQIITEQGVLTPAQTEKAFVLRQKEASVLNKAMPNK